MAKAIVIPANPFLKYKFGPTMGSILDHASHIEKYGKVFWGITLSAHTRKFFSLDRVREFPHNNIQKGYFYSVQEKAVTHAFDVDCINRRVDWPLRLPRSVSQYFTPARLQRDKKKGYNSYYILISGIYKLKRKHQIMDFVKSDGTKLKAPPQVYIVASDPNYKYWGRKITKRDIMSDYISDLLLRGKVTEKDIENLFFHNLAVNQELVQRQGSFKGGRLDLIFRSRQYNYTIYEIKRGVAPLSTLTQIKRYMKNALRRGVLINGVKHKIPKKRMRGVILCKDAEPELWNAVKSEDSIKIKRYFFEVGMR